MNAAQSPPGFFDNVSLYFDLAASFTEHPKGLLDQIKVCNSVYSFQFPVRTRRGYEVISGWRVQHSHHKRRNSVSKGGQSLSGWRSMKAPSITLRGLTSRP